MAPRFAMKGGQSRLQALAPLPLPWEEADNARSEVAEEALDN